MVFKVSRCFMVFKVFLGENKSKNRFFGQPDHHSSG